MVDKWKGFREVIDRINKGSAVSKEDKDKYYKFLKEISAMMDEVPDIVGIAVRRHFWGEINREEMLRRLPSYPATSNHA